ncbi:conserved hypothetical protein [groundwater metagenome]|uniref:Fido domain-containing protein n=1 Tax=groundwater metagenome TaxID=717931 RepID=A0A098E772_9ZZZZ
MYNPKYEISNKLLNCLNRISAAHNLITNAPLIPKWESKLREDARIKSAHFSTRIEGNTLTLDEVRDLFDGKEVYAKPRDKQEVVNYRKVLEFVDGEPEISLETMKEINRITLEKIDDENGGKFRKIQNYIVKETNRKREIIYTPPPAKEIPGMMHDLAGWISGAVKEEISPVIIAGVAHYEFVSIHPFLDGNGRTARALATLILYKLGYDTKRLFSLEEHYDLNLAGYYSALQSAQENRDNEREELTLWLEYFAEGIANELTRIEKQILDISRDKALKDKLGQLELNERQMKAVSHILKYERITNREYVKKFGVSNATAKRDLNELTSMKLLMQKGRGRSVYYIIMT